MSFDFAVRVGLINTGLEALPDADHSEQASGHSTDDPSITLDPKSLPVSAPTDAPLGDDKINTGGVGGVGGVGSLANLLPLHGLIGLVESSLRPKPGDARDSGGESYTDSSIPQRTLSDRPFHSISLPTLSFDEASGKASVQLPHTPTIPPNTSLPADWPIPTDPTHPPSDPPGDYGDPAEGAGTDAGGEISDDGPGTDERLV